MINAEDIISNVNEINAISPENEKRCYMLANACLSPYQDKKLSAQKEKMLCFYLAAKINLQMCMYGDDVTSFSAGDVKISKSSKNAVDCAKELCMLAFEGVSDIVKDNDFAFMGV